MSKQRTQNRQLGEAIRRKNQKQLGSWIDNGMGMADMHWTLVVVGRFYVLYPCLLEGVNNGPIGYKRDAGPANLLGGWDNNGQA